MPNTPRLGRQTDRPRYVLGLAFNLARTRVALICKARGPRLNHSLFNGLGGEVHGRETYIQAMRREFREEGGPLVEQWSLFAIIEGDDYRIQVFRAFLDDHQWRRVRTLGRSLTDEQVAKCSVARIRPSRTAEADLFVPDLYWLVPLALKNDRAGMIHDDRRLW